jgi:hypothetical protein
MSVENNKELLRNKKCLTHGTIRIIAQAKQWQAQQFPENF